MTGMTMHIMHGLPALHFRDLVNWRLLGYAFDRTETGLEYRLEPFVGRAPARPVGNA